MDFVDVDSAKFESYAGVRQPVYALGQCAEGKS